MKNLYMLAALVFGVLLTSDVAFAAEIGVLVSEQNFCITGISSFGGTIVSILGVVVVVASTAANTVSKDSILGKIVHFLAINLTVDKAKK